MVDEEIFGGLEQTDIENLLELQNPDMGIFSDEIPKKPEIVYHITDFDGPLDLLYTLIKAAKISIDDIFISEITGQYVEIVTNTPKEELDFEYAGKFIAMAAELLYLKSIHSLPKDDEDYDEDDPEFEKQLLINKLKEFALLKEESEKLKELETTNRFTRMPVYTEKDYRVALVNFSLPKLVSAFASVLVASDRREAEAIPKKVEKDRFSVHDQMLNIFGIMEKRTSMLFSDLFEPDYSKSDIVTTFLAMLELMKYGILTAKQEETFGDIYIDFVEGANLSLITYEENENGQY